MNQRGAESMSTSDTVYPFEIFFEKISEKVVFESKSFKRIHHIWNEECSQLVDVHSAYGMRVHCLRVSTDDAPKTLRLSSAGRTIKVSNVSDLGTLLSVDYEQKQYTVWLPAAVGVFSLDEYNRLSRLDQSPCTYQWKFSSSIELRLFLPGYANGLAVISYVVVEDPHGQFAEDLASLLPVEKRLYRKSDLFFS
jgi:hypothetical protein